MTGFARTHYILNHRRSLSEFIIYYLFIILYYLKLFRTGNARPYIVISKNLRIRSTEKLRYRERR